MSTLHRRPPTIGEQVEAAAQAVLGEPIVAFIDECRQRPHPESQLIAVLHKVQAQFGYLAEAHLDAVAQLLQVPAAKVAGVASFYHFFRLKPRGKFMINVCLGTACYVKGADRVAAEAHRRAGHHLGRDEQGRRLHPRSLPLPRHLRPGPGRDDRRRDPRPTSRPTRCRRCWRSISRRRGSRSVLPERTWRRASPQCRCLSAPAVLQW